MFDTTSIATVIGIIVAIAGLYEWRIRSMYTELHNKIIDRDQVHKIIQDGLKEDIARLETKVDMMLTLLMRSAMHDKDQ